MKKENRIIRIVEMLRREKKLDVSTVCKSLHISESTVRRLFNQLGKEGKAIRIHGGIKIAPQFRYDYSYFLSSHHRSQQKSTIGRFAATLIVNNDRIFLDGGTTVMKLAEALSLNLQTKKIDGIVVLSNSLSVVEILANWCKVLLVGGEVRFQRKDLCGVISEKVLNIFNVNKAFLGADGLDIKQGIMTMDERTARMNEIILNKTNDSFVLADSEKMNKPSFISYSSLSRITKIITDAELSDSTYEKYVRAGANIHRVEESSLPKD